MHIMPEMPRYAVWELLMAVSRVPVNSHKAKVKGLICRVPLSSQSGWFTPLFF